MLSVVRQRESYRMNILVGRKDKLAFEYVTQNQNLHLGRVFLYVASVKFGQDEFDEDIHGFLDRVLEDESNCKGNYEELFKLSANDFCKYIHCLWGELDDDLCSKYQYLKFDIDDIDEELLLRAGYALDRHVIALIPSRDGEKLLVANQGNLDVAEIILSKGGFYMLLNEFKNTINKKFEAKGDGFI